MNGSQDLDAKVLSDASRAAAQERQERWKENTLWVVGPRRSIPCVPAALGAEREAACLLPFSPEWVA